jgi:gamma-glutamylputrescine oxidase
MTMFSYWEKEIFKPQYDCLIIGSGFAGLWSAFFLKKAFPDFKIAILERGSMPMGASTKNAGFSCFGSPSELLENVRNIGWAKTLETTQKRFEGIKIIKQYFQDTIAYNACGASELFVDSSIFKENAEKLVHLNEKLHAIVGIENHFYIDNQIVEQSNFSGFQHAISNSSEAAIHSGKLFMSLYKTLVAQDVVFLFGTEVESIQTENSTAFVKTKQLGEFLSRHVCVCTNAFANKLLPQAAITPGRGQVLITKPIPHLPFNRTFHFEKGYYYFRNVGSRVLFGGGRNLDFNGETTECFGNSERILAKLNHYLTHYILPGVEYEIDMVWSGIMGFTETGTPISSFLKNNLSVQAGMNGMGVALTPFLARQWAEGMEHRWG